MPIAASDGGSRLRYYPLNINSFGAQGGTRTPTGYGKDGVEYAGGYESENSPPAPILAPNLGNACAELAEIVSAWPTLSDGLRHAVLTLLRATLGGGR